MNQSRAGGHGRVSRAPEEAAVSGAAHGPPTKPGICQGVRVRAPHVILVSLFLCPLVSHFQRASIGNMSNGRMIRPPPAMSQAALAASSREANHGPVAVYSVSSSLPHSAEPTYTSRAHVCVQQGHRDAIGFVVDRHVSKAPLHDNSARYLPRSTTVQDRLDSGSPRPVHSSSPARGDLSLLGKLQRQLEFCHPPRLPQLFVLDSLDSRADLVEELVHLPVLAQLQVLT